MASKVCPRCGMQYANLKSATCPQCFAKLVVVDDETAQEMASARALIEGTAEFQQVKADDDERFREQSFGACMAVIGIAIATVVFIIAVIVVAYNRHHHHAVKPTQTARISASRPGTLDILTVLPLASAPIEEVLPAKIPGYEMTKRDQETVLPGTLTHIDHAQYRIAGTKGSVIDLFGIPTGHSTSEQNEFRLGISLYAQLGSRQPRPMQIFATEQWRFAAVGQTDAVTNASLDQFRSVLADQFRS